MFQPIWLTGPAPFYLAAFIFLFGVVFGRIMTNIFDPNRPPLKANRFYPYLRSFLEASIWKPLADGQWYEFSLKIMVNGKQCSIAEPTLQPVPPTADPNRPSSWENLIVLPWAPNISGEDIFDPEQVYNAEEIAL